LAYSVSQIIEALGRFVIGLYLANLLLGRGVEYAAAGGTIGTTAGSLLGCISLIIYYFYIRIDIATHKDEFMAYEYIESTKSILGRLLRPLIPVSIAALAVSIMPLIDSLLVKNSLFATGILERESTILFGNLGAATTLISFPLTISYAVSITIIPTISNATAKGDHANRINIISDALKITFYLMIPAAIGLFILSSQIMQAIFPNIENALWILRFSSITLIVISVNQIVVATLQGLGLFMKPVKNIFIGAFIKIIISYTLMRIPEINILGAIIGTFVGYCVTTYRSSKSLVIENVLKVSHFKHIIKPLIASIFMGIYLYVLPFIANISLVSTIVSAFIIYIVVMNITGAIDIKKITNYILKKVEDL
ncbi:MAG: polysaccharide biosynthesis C-terminal domain-containing protein, partial [Acidaminobacteraceae bacterium]